MPAATDDLEMLVRSDALARLVTGAVTAEAVGCFPANA